MDRVELPPVYTRAEALTAGLTRAQLRDDGVRVTRGAYVSRAVPLALETACSAAMAVLPPSAVFSHRTAAAVMGAPLRRTWPLAVSVPPGAPRPRRARIRTHVRRLEGDDVTRCRGVPVTSGAQTWLDLVPELPPEELIAIGDSLMRVGPLDELRLAERLARAGGTRGIVLARRLAPVLTPLAASRPESLTRYWLWDAGFPPAVSQVPVLDRWGRVVAHGDLGFPAWKVLVEYEVGSTPSRGSSGATSTGTR